jgi:hypothetical protein
LAGVAGGFGPFAWRVSVEGGLGLDGGFGEAVLKEEMDFLVLAAGNGGTLARNSKACPVTDLD